MLIQQKKRGRKASVQHCEWWHLSCVRVDRASSALAAAGAFAYNVKRKKPLLKAIHEWYFVHIIKREHRCVRASALLLTGLRTEEIMLCARLVRDVRRRAIKLGYLDRNRRDHRDIKILVEHRRTPVDPQIRRGRPRIWLVLERERKLRYWVKHREGSMRLPSVHTNVQCLECGRRIWGSLR